MNLQNFIFQFISFALAKVDFDSEQTILQIKKLLQEGQYKYKYFRK